MVHQANILTDSSNKCLIALGSNQPFEYIHSFELIKKAINYLADRKLRITGTSRFYQTPAFPKESGPDFVNAVVSADTKLSGRLAATGGSAGRRARWTLI